MSETYISAIVPTIGREAALDGLLKSLHAQTVPVHEIVIADASERDDVAEVCERWRSKGLAILHLPVFPPNAVFQRKAAIGYARGGLLLFLDDDVALEPDCVERLLEQVRAHVDVVGASATFNNQPWPNPTRAWSLYLRAFHGISNGNWQGRVIGPLLRFGYHPVPATPQPMEWLGTGNSLVRRDAFQAVGGFSEFFLHRCTMNEDVDLGIKLARVGRILLVPAARLAHYHAPSGRVSPATAAEDDIYNRYMVLKETVGLSRLRAFLLVATYVAIENLSNLLGAIKRGGLNRIIDVAKGRVRGLIRILLRPLSA